MPRMSRWAVFAVFSAFAAAAVVLAEPYAQFPGPPIDGDTLRIKQKVEHIYASGNYGRALLIYAKELAPQGDKYAQYMTGYMHLNGQGAAADPAAALAWYRLAAERGEPKFIEARDALAASLDDSDRARADEIFAELWERHGDRRILLELIERDIDVLRESAVDGFAGPSSGVGLSAGYSRQDGGNPYYRRVRSQLEERLAWLDGHRKVPAGADSARLDELEADLRRELEALDLP